jgi:hypothetical protein
MVRIRQPELVDSNYEIARMELPECNGQNGAARTGQPEWDRQNRTCKAVQAEHDSQNGQAERER